MRQQDRCPDHVPPPGRLFGLRRLGRAERLDEVQRPAFRERIGLGRQIGEDRIDCGVDLLVDGFGGSEEFRDDPVGSRANRNYPRGVREGGVMPAGGRCGALAAHLAGSRFR
jgi:hypothetical protein